MESRGDRIAVFGGTFDPPHIGHFGLAEEILKHGYAEKVMFVPALSPPHKPNQPRSPFEDRLEMLSLGLEKIGEERFILDDVEGKRKGKPSYTFDTMVELSGKYPDVELLLLIGGDSLLNLHTWYRAEEIVIGWDVLTYPRKGFKLIPEINNFWPKGVASLLVDTILPFEIFDVSSTEIRERIRNNKKLDGIVFPEIINYIKRKGLYKSV